MMNIYGIIFNYIESNFTKRNFLISCNEYNEHCLEVLPRGQIYPQYVRACTTFAKDPHLVLKTHVRPPRVSLNSSPRYLMLSSGASPGNCGHKPTETHLHVCY